MQRLGKRLKLRRGETPFLHPLLPSNSARKEDARGAEQPSPECLGRWMKTQADKDAVCWPSAAFSWPLGDLWSPSWHGDCGDEK